RARTVARHEARPGTSADVGATPRPPHPKREPTGCLRTATRGARPGRPFLTRRSTMNPTIDPTMDPPTFPLPDERGRFGPYGGRYVPETLIPALDELTAAYRDARADGDFMRRFERILREYVGRPSLLYRADNLTRRLSGARIYLKREDLNHTGAHKITNTVGQVLLAARMGKRRV